MNDGLLQLSDLVQQRCGLNFSKKLVSLENKTKKRLAELGCDYPAYHARLVRDPHEWDRLIELLTVHETYFFREDHHLRALCDVVIPELQQRRSGAIRIWSAACSTGEEPYSIAMAVAEQNVFRSGQVKIIATDIDTKTLDTAMNGWYSTKSFSFRRTPEYYLTKYFDQDGDGYRMKPGVRRMVEFSRLNLMDESAIRRLGNFDVIFCRNVLIYFDQDGKQHVIRSLHEQLHPGGYLFMGHAESISNAAGKFRTMRGESTFYYKKEDTADGIRGLGGR